MKRFFVLFPLAFVAITASAARQTVLAPGQFPNPGLPLVVSTADTQTIKDVVDIKDVKSVHAVVVEDRLQMTFETPAGEAFMEAKVVESPLLPSCTRHYVGGIKKGDLIIDVSFVSNIPKSASESQNCQEVKEDLTLFVFQRNGNAVDAKGLFSFGSKE